MFNYKLSAVLLTTLTFACGAPADEPLGVAEEMPTAEMQGTGSVIPDVVYGHKDGMALTFDVSSQSRLPMGPACSTSRAEAGGPDGDPVTTQKRDSNSCSAVASRSSWSVTGAPLDSTRTTPMGMSSVPCASYVSMPSPMGSIPTGWASTVEVPGGTCP